MEWEALLETVLIIVPSIIALGKWLDIKSSKRQESNNKFNQLLLWGVESIGGLTAANTKAIKSGDAGGETEVALAEYQRFHSEITKFKNEQAVRSL